MKVSGVKRAIARGRLGFTIAPDDVWLRCAS